MRRLCTCETSERGASFNTSRRESGIPGGVFGGETGSLLMLLMLAAGPPLIPSDEAEVGFSRVSRYLSSKMMTMAPLLLIRPVSDTAEDSYDVLLGLTMLTSQEQMHVPRSPAARCMMQRQSSRQSLARLMSRSLRQRLPQSPKQQRRPRVPRVRCCHQCMATTFRPFHTTPPVRCYNGTAADC